MPLENGEPQQAPTSDAELLGFDPVGAGTFLDSELKRIEALGEAEKPKPQAQKQQASAPEESTREKATGEELLVEEVTPTEKGFAFRGKTYEDEGKAKHARDSFIGQLRKVNQERDAAQRRVTELETELAEARRLSQPATIVKQSAETPPASENVTPKGLDAFVDWSTYQHLYDDPDMGPAVAQRYLVLKNQEYLDSVRKDMESRFEAKLEGRLKGVEMTEQMRRDFEAETGWFYELADREDADGNKLFPEIQPDTGDLDFITRVATRFKADPSLRAMEGYGVYLAYLAEKDWEKFNVPEIKEVPRDEHGRFTKASEALDKFDKDREAAKAASVLTGESRLPGMSATTTRGYKPGTWKEKALSGLEKAGTATEDKTLMGF